MFDNAKLNSSCRWQWCLSGGGGGVGTGTGVAATVYQWASLPKDYFLFRDYLRYICRDRTCYISFEREFNALSIDMLHV